MGAERDRFELLAAVGEVADGTLSLDETVQRLLEIVVPAFADLATLDAISPRGQARRLGARADATVGETERFGEDRLARTLHGAAGAGDAVRRIEEAVSRFAHGPQADDTAVLAVERSTDVRSAYVGSASRV